MSGAAARPGLRSPFAAGEPLLVRRRPAPRRARRAAAPRADLYGILQVPDTATKAELRTAYRALAKKLHPDLHAGRDPGFRFQAVTDAYAVLSNESLRRRYDSGGYAALGGRFARFADGPPSAKRKAEQGKDVLAVMWLDLVEAALGVTRQLEVKVAITCPECQGVRSAAAAAAACPLCRGSGETKRRLRSHGGAVMLGPCPMCGGKGATAQQWCAACGSSGKARVSRSLRVTVPPGVDDSSVLRLKGSGDEGSFGGRPGDCYVSFVVRARRDITRRGLDLHSDVTVAYTDAILGSAYEVQTIRGTALLQIPPGTQHGTVLRMAGAGVAAPRGGSSSSTAAAGSHLWRVCVRLPVAVGSRERALLQRLCSLQKPAAAQAQTQAAA